MLRKNLLTLWLVALVAASPAFAQGTTSRLLGVVTDQTGAVVPGATVTLTNEATGVSFTTVTTGAGTYTFEAIQVGTYTVAVELQGFKKFVARGNPINISEPTTVNVKLEPGGIEQQVEVTAAAPVVQAAAQRQFVLLFDLMFSSPVGIMKARDAALAFVREAVAAATGGVVTYTPNPGASGTDSLVYVLQDSLGNVSNAATVTLTVPFVAPPPTANADSFAMLQNTSRTYAILANDVAGVGTTINVASVTIVTPPAHGIARPNLDGTVTYTPTIGFNSALDTFSYTVANDAGVASAPATVTVEVFGGPEAVSFSKINYTVSKAKWTIVGSTNWFNAALTQDTVTCWLNVTGNPVIGTAPIDTFGKFQLVPLFGPNPPNPSSVTCQTSNGGIKSGGVVFN